MQPFSRRYFEGGALTSFAREWRQVLDTPELEASHSVAPLTETPAADLKLLAKLLRSPCQLFFNERLKIYLGNEQQVLAEDEPFTLNALEQYQLTDQLLAASLDGTLDRELERLKGSGACPWPVLPNRP